MKLNSPNSSTDDSLKTGSSQTMAVGSFNNRGNREFLPVSATELDRGQTFYSAILSSFRFQANRNFLVSSLMDGISFFAALEQAAAELGLVVCSTDDSFFDAPRVESTLRRFDVAGVAAISGAALDGMAHFNIDPHKVFDDTPVWAYPEATERLSNCNLHRYMQLGPAAAMECKHKLGMHIDQREWLVESIHGELHLTSLRSRALDFKDFNTGVKGTIDNAVCDCGLSDPRIHLQPN